MTVFKANRAVAVHPDVAFEVAADVASYRLFLPLLQRSTVRGTIEVTAEGQRFDAELAVAYQKLGLTETFLSHVNTNTAARTVQAKSTDAPFRSLSAVWMVTAVEDKSDVRIEIDYQFRNPFLQMVASGLMDMAVQRVMAAFEARALALSAEARSRL